MIKTGEHLYDNTDNMSVYKKYKADGISLLSHRSYIYNKDHQILKDNPGCPSDGKTLRGIAPNFIYRRGSGRYHFCDRTSRERLRASCEYF